MVLLLCFLVIVNLFRHSLDSRLLLCVAKIQLTSPEKRKNSLSIRYNYLGLNLYPFICGPRCPNAKHDNISSSGCHNTGYNIVGWVLFFQLYFFYIHRIGYRVTRTCRREISVNFCYIPMKSSSSLPLCAIKEKNKEEGCKKRIILL